MKCSRHPNNEAIGQCAQCGAFVCRECAQATSVVKSDYGTLCVDCYGDLVADAIGAYRKDRKKKIRRVIISIICYFFGMFMIISGLKEQLFQMLIVGVVLCGFYTGLTWRKAAQETHEEDERKHGVTYEITSNGIERKDGFWFKLVFFLIGTALGVVVTPIRVIIDIVGAARSKKTIASLNAELEDIQSI